MAAESDVEAIRNWLLKQPHLPQNVEERLVARFLVCCDGSLELTKTTMELFFSLRSATPEIFRERDPLQPNIQQVFNTLDLVPLDGLTPDGYACFIYRFCDPDPDKFHFMNLVKMMFMMGDTHIRSSELGLVPGLVPIFDMSGWSFRHVTKIQFSILSNCMQYCQEAQPVKVKQVHVINANSLIDKFIPLIKPFMKNEVVSMIHIHPTGSNTLFDFVPKEILPEEYGGLAGPLQKMKNFWKLQFEAEREWFLKCEWMTDESKKIGHRNGNLRLGLEGSFRTLSVD